MTPTEVSNINDSSSDAIMQVTQRFSLNDLHLKRLPRYVEKYHLSVRQLRDQQVAKSFSIDTFSVV